MITSPDRKLTRIGVFYDGGYFAVVSDYYRFHHARRQRLSIGGIHYFIRRKVAELEGVDEKYCQVVDAHYFRGRFSASDTKDHGKLYSERSFDDVLMRAGVITHYLPRSIRGEKGVDVWLALEAFELAAYKRFDVLVLIAGDGDYLPLVRKLNTLGTRVMLLAWDFTFTGKAGRSRECRVAQSLINDATYPIAMHDLIDNRANRGDPVIDGLFVPQAEEGGEEDEEDIAQAVQLGPAEPPAGQAGPGPTLGNGSPAPAPGEERAGVVCRLPAGKGYGFIKTDDSAENDWLFISRNVLPPGFANLSEGDRVSFVVAENPERGGFWAIRVKKL
ncbi:MAG: NYN domain-containing protein [Planctomycetes bacterium]|nr:NYN domain-containing protein [Planctomycetota bacterium]